MTRRAPLRAAEIEAAAQAWLTYELACWPEHDTQGSVRLHPAESRQALLWRRTADLLAGLDDRERACARARAGRLLSDWHDMAGTQQHVEALA